MVGFGGSLGWRGVSSCDAHDGLQVLEVAHLLEQSVVLVLELVNLCVPMPHVFLQLVHFIDLSLHLQVFDLEFMAQGAMLLY